jgi:hypothetical protein
VEHIGEALEKLQVEEVVVHACICLLLVVHHELSQEGEQVIVEQVLDVVVV